MGIKDDQKTVAAVVSMGLHDQIEHEALMAGLSLSRHIANILSEHATGELATSEPMRVRTIDNRGRVKLPAELVAALDIRPTTPLAIFPFHRGALIRPVR